MQRYFSKIKDNNIFTLNNDDMYHINTVMRMKNNELLEVVYEEEVYLCEYLNNSIVIKEKIPNKTDNLAEIILAIPLLKEAKMDLILQKSTELGVSKIIPIITERSIIKLENDRENKKLVRWNKICKEAAEQSMRINIPIVTEVKKMEELKDIPGLKIICSTNERENSLRKCLNNNKNYDKIIIVIGPEGGLSEQEEVRLENIGFEKVTLGNRIMRVETVPLFILSVLNYENME